MDKSTVITCLLVSVLILQDTRWCGCKASSANTSALRCTPYERAALLNFKHSLKHFDKDVSSSWEGEDCCKWGRVACDNTTGRVIKLNLKGDETNNLIEMEKLESLVYLLELKQLESLDLSLNNFSYSSIPKFMGSMKQLRCLNLSHCSLGGLVPHELGNLTNLQVLDLRGDYEIVIDSLGWATGLRELRYLNMYGSDMSNAHDWLESLVGPLPHIMELHLSFCELTVHQAAHKNSSFAARLPIRYLDLSRNHLGGEIPDILQNLTSLEHLDLSNSISFAQFDVPDNSIELKNLWGLVHNLCSLRWLDMSENDLQGNFMQPRPNTSNNCHNQYDMEELSIQGSSLNGEILAWLGDEFKSLRSISLSTNMLSGEIPASLSMLSTLRTLDLSDNMLSGEIPASLSKLSTLRTLDLSQNNLSSIASSLRFPSNLETITLSENQLSGKIPTSIGQLSKLQGLDLSSNSLLEGTVLSEAHFANLSSLTDIGLDNTFLTLNLSSGWVPPFQLQSFAADTCRTNGQFPPWLQTQKYLGSLSLSNANITGIMPRWFHTMQNLSLVDLSNNKLSGSPIFPINFYYINLSNNSLSETLPSNDSQNEVYRHATSIMLPNNFISGSLPENLGHIMPNLQTLILSSNHIIGPIPKSFCQLTSLSILDIQKNRLSGTIPNCWANISGLSLVNLSYNKLRGRIPCFYSRGPFKDPWSDQFYLHLNDNLLSGEIPSCLNKLTNMQVFDIGGNQLSGEMSLWFAGEKFTALKILRLRGNNFSGTISSQICSLSQLQILDIGHNNFHGSIPECLSNLTAMSSPDTNAWETDGEDVNEVIQGIERAYTSTLQFLVDIDLSCNNLVGSIPNEITNLSSLLSLNLSYNQLSESVPQDIGDLKSLISLDLSRNKLKGIIPISLGQLYSLSHLNLSYNNFSGQIPTGSQLQTLTDPSNYAGNPYLCGDSLPRKCESNNDGDHSGTGDEGDQDDDEEDKSEKMWFYLVVMSGVATGFWGVVGSLVLKREWRHAFFRRVDDAYDWVCVAVAVVVSMAKLKKR